MKAKRKNKYSSNWMELPYSVLLEFYLRFIKPKLEPVPGCNCVRYTGEHSVSPSAHGRAVATLYYKGVNYHITVAKLICHLFVEAFEDDGSGRDCCLHKCKDSPWCVSRKCVRRGTQGENVREAIIARGRTNRNANIKPAEVIAIRAMRKAGYLLNDIARVTGRKINTISKVANYRVHKNVCESSLS